MSLVENAGSIVISLVLQIIIFGDIPNTVKILGAILTVTSIIIIGIQKIFKARAKRPENSFKAWKTREQELSIIGGDERKSKGKFIPRRELTN